MINYTSSGMGNLKCENVWHVQSNVTTAKFATNLTANISLLSAVLGKNPSRKKTPGL